MLRWRLQVSHASYLQFELKVGFEIWYNQLEKNGFFINKKKNENC